MLETQLVRKCDTDNINFDSLGHHSTRFMKYAWLGTFREFPLTKLFRSMKSVIKFGCDRYGRCMVVPCKWRKICMFLATGSNKHDGVNLSIVNIIFMGRGLYNGSGNHRWTNWSIHIMWNFQVLSNHCWQYNFVGNHRCMASHYLGCDGGTAIFCIKTWL